MLEHGREGEAAEVGSGVLVVPGRDRSPLLEPAEASFDDIAVAVAVGGELWGSPSAAATISSALDLIGLLRNGAADSSTAQFAPCRWVGVCLVCKEMQSIRGKTCCRASDLVAVQQWHQSRVVTGLPSGQDQLDGSYQVIDDGVDLGREPAAGPAESSIVRFGGTLLQTGILVIRWCPFLGRCRRATAAGRRRHVDEHGQCWNRRRPAAQPAPVQSHLDRGLVCGGGRSDLERPRTSSGTCRYRTRADDGAKRSAISPDQKEDPATGHRPGSATRSLQEPAGEASRDVPAGPTDTTEAPTQSLPTTHQKSCQHASPQDHRPRSGEDLSDTL